MNIAQGLIAFFDRINDNPECNDVIDLIDGQILVHHLFVDAVEVLGPAFDGCLNPDFFQFSGDQICNFQDKLFAFIPPMCSLGLDFFVYIRL